MRQTVKALKPMIEGFIETNGELSLKRTLKSGQAFRWRLTNDGTDWVGVVRNTHVVQLTQQPDGKHIHYRVLNGHEDNDHNQEIKPTVKGRKRLKTSDESDGENPKDQYFYSQLISDYLRLDVNLTDLYDKWSKSDDKFAAIAVNMSGVRVLRQNFAETLFSFICSSNNNINRIEKMIETLCQKYGKVLYESHPELGTIHSFPEITRLAEESVEPELKKLGFGYRSAFIHRSAKTICDEYKCPEKWSQELAQMPYSEARQALQRLPGVGPKVADCIALMALNHLESVPVDVHVFKIAQHMYLPHLKKNKSLTHKSYQEIGDFFRSKFGPNAGWAQAVLFCADLKQFKQ
ncbi:unnamed protein product [Medioppia subpectinata]|uniref:N-glycosylase/DNA lyase n=1 Tax=Medioppia subpectinata TaxID=1979941 RepID=A0A7R9KCE6_9ACAR|nr:unnamed protein product [Medioppia subpectinata]CAG2100519.1 unnamed protein product [Medioppia subpectinata]